MFIKHTVLFSIISFKGLRDDLTCILDEELSSMHESLCFALRNEKDRAVAEECWLAGL